MQSQFSSFKTFKIVKKNFLSLVLGNQRRNSNEFTLQKLPYFPQGARGGWEGLRRGGGKRSATPLSPVREAVEGL
jgi:hypothetical protein